MAKSPDAFRTISEVADWLGVQAHVLRFWESKFAQVKPIKRAGGRRYYRPADMLLLGGIKKLLHDDGLTIKGMQKLLRENGVAHVADLSQPLDDLTIAVIEGSANPAEEVAVEEDADLAAPRDMEDAPQEAAPIEAAQSETNDDTVTPQAETEDGDPEESEASSEVAVAQNTEEEAATFDDAASDDVHDEVEPEDEEAPEAEDVQASFDESDTESGVAPSNEEEPANVDVPPQGEQEPMPMPSFRARPRSSDTPSFAHQAPVSQEVDTPEPMPVDTPITEDAESAPAAALIPRIVDLPLIPPHSEIEVETAALSVLSRLKRISPEHAREIKPLVARLTRLRASMSNPRKEPHKD